MKNLQILTWKQVCLFMAIGLLFLMFFIGGPGYYSPRSLKYSWDLGHIVFFAFFPIMFVKSSNTVLNEKRIFFYVLILTLLLGGIVELLQTGFHGRIKDAGDIFRNIIGAIFYWVFLSPYRNGMGTMKLLLVRTLVISLIILQTAPIARALWDENLARKQFPLLAGFESSLEVERWTGSAVFGITNEIKKRGDASLKVMLDTSKYSGISLKYFPNNWQKYNYFQFAVFNPKNSILKLTCRIHDRVHTQGLHEYSDRFNQSFSIGKGWHTIRIPLEAVRTAPKTRDMDMRHVQGMGIFASELPTPRHVYIDDVRLAL